MSMPRTTKPRPALPTRANPYLSANTVLAPVKFQPIQKDGNTVIVGRVKIQVPASKEQPNGHGYVLRRYDTGFISLSTMWKGAFPNALQQEEKDEVAWVKANFDCTIPTGEREGMRLAGTWIPVQVARFLSPSYSLTSVIAALENARPDPEPKGSETPVTGKASTHSSTGPNKRRKETHDSPSKIANGTPVKAEKLAPPTPTTGGKTRQKTKSPAPPAARSTPTRGTKSRKAPSPAPSDGTGQSRRSTRLSTLPQHREEAESEEDDKDVKPPIPNPDEDIAESQSLVQRLMAQQQKVTAPVASAAKRTRDVAEAPLTLNLDQPSQEVTYIPPAERALVTNRRVLPQWPTMPQLEPSQKSAAWGTLAFAIGWGAAATLLPQLF